jgi:hypothetical protein
MKNHLCVYRESNTVKGRVKVSKREWESEREREKSARNRRKNVGEIVKNVMEIFDWLVLMVQGVNFKHFFFYFALVILRKKKVCKEREWESMFTNQHINYPFFSNLLLYDTCKMKFNVKIREREFVVVLMVMLDVHKMLLSCCFLYFLTFFFSFNFFVILLFNEEGQVCVCVRVCEFYYTLDSNGSALSPKFFLFSFSSWNRKVSSIQSFSYVKMNYFHNDIHKYWEQV